MNFVEKNDVSAKAPDKTKRPYEAPILSEYGDIRRMTQTTQSRMGSGDNHKANAKTLP
jgi:hypothetical protein